MALIFGISGKAGSGKDTIAQYLAERHGFLRVSLADEMKRFTKNVFGFTDEQLWGPSENRNAVDRRYDDIDKWGLAFDNLEVHGPAWCAFLFGEERGAEAFLKLIDWFYALEDAHAPLAGRTNTLSPRVVLQTIGTEFGRAVDDKVWVRATMNVAKQTLAEGRAKGVVIADVRFKNEVDGVREEGGVNFRVKRPGAKLAQVGIAGHASEAEMDSVPDEAFDHILVSPEGIANLHVYLHGIMPIIIRSRS